MIEHADPVAGFSALITHALNGVRKALENNWLPVVKYDNHEVNDYFYDPALGENVWDYYFEPVMGSDYTRVKHLLDAGKISQDQIHTYPPGLVRKWHHDDPDRIATFWARDEPENRTAWMAEKRQLGREYVARYIKVKPHILAKVQQFYNDNFKTQYMIGVHIRGTDFEYAEPTDPKIYFAAIRNLVAENNLDDFNIFVATDQNQFVDMFQQEFGRRIITYASIRSNSDVPAFQFTDVSPYKKGEDVLIDILLLSKCDYLFKGAAAVGEYALWFNPTLECTDFALESHFNTQSVMPAYLKLNIGQLPSIQWRLLTLYKEGKIRLLDAAMVIGRALLPASLRDWLWRTVVRHLYYPENNAD